MVSTQLPGIHNEYILLSIFSFLPILDLARCAAVCKQWYKVVTGCTQIWKGKTYTSEEGPRISDEMHDILFALPLLHKVEVKVEPLCYGKVCYPCLSLTVGSISDLRAVRDWQKVRCTYLSIHLNIAGFLFSSHSPIDFSVLEKLDLQLNRVWQLIKPVTTAECAIRCALQLCPNLRELSIFVESLSADYLDVLEGMSRLRTLKIHCNRLEKLVFLRHCSEALEDLELGECLNMPSAAYVELRCLGNLRRLRLHCCHVEEGDLEVATLGLRSLESLELSMCNIEDLSFLRHCGQLREISIVVSYQWQTVRLPTGLGQLPTSVRSLCLIGSAATPDELSEALPCLPSLEQLSLSCEQLDRLDFLHGCRQLRRLCLGYSICPDETQLLNLRHLSQLETLDLPGTTDDLEVLSSVMPSLPHLENLTIGYREDVDYVDLLQDFPRLLTTALFGKDGNPCEISDFEKFDFNIDECKYVCKFVCEVV